jgi:TolB protein
MVVFRRLLPSLLILSLLGAACVADQSGASTTTAVSEDRVSGRVVVLDDGGNIVTMNPDGSERVSITDDGASVRYFQPVWSPADSTIAWGQLESSGASVGLARDDGTEVRKVALAQFPFYFNWSPDGERIGLLHNGAEQGIDFEIVDVDGLLTSVVDSGSPYYFSWSPDGDAVVVHADGDRLAIFDESANPTDVGTPLPEFLSPRWTEAGIFFLGPRGVVLRAPDGENRLLGETTGFININPSPDGSKVAIHTLGGSPGITVGLTTQEIIAPNAVTIVDTATGVSVVASEEFSLGSFWSPDGEKLMMLVPGSSEEEVDIVIWNGGEVTDVGAIGVSGSLVREALQYFDQYAQSWQIWSPSSDAIVFPGTVAGEAGIWVIGIDGGQPTRIGDGDWAAWSHG